MPTYSVRHLTRYTYDEPISVCHNIAHLLPREAPRHDWAYADVRVDPDPGVRSERCDYFGNRQTFFAIQEPHKELDVLATGQVTIDPLLATPLNANLAWERIRDSLPAVMSPDYVETVEYTFASPYVQLVPEVAAYARRSFTEGRPALEAALDLIARIHDDFTYDTQSTTITTTLPEILHHRSGVCQDFAHLAVGCLRSLGLPARYVSGYLLTAPPPGKPRLIGADASHAWVSLFLPDSGWLDLDPTNNLLPSDKHITIAWGRDFGDVSPVRGVLLGAGKHRIDVSVDVSPLD